MENKTLTIEATLIDNKLNIKANSSFTYLEVLGLLDSIKEDILINNRNKQLNEPIDNKLNNGLYGVDNVSDWAKKLKAEKRISTRLYNFLTDPMKFKQENISEITKEEFLKYRGCGIFYWNEFERLRSLTIKRF